MLLQGFVGAKEDQIFRNKVMAEIPKPEICLQHRKLRSSYWFALIGFLQVLLAGTAAATTVLVWSFAWSHVHHLVAAVANSFQQQWLDHAESHTISIFESCNASSVTLSNFIHSNAVEDGFSSYPMLEKEVNPALFLAYSTNPYITHVFFMGKTGLFVSYYSDSGETFMVFSNTSEDSGGGNAGNSTKPIWYYKAISAVTGIPTGEPLQMDGDFFWKKSWFQQALYDNHGSNKLGVSFTRLKETLFLFQDSVKDKSLTEQGVVALGVPAKILLNFTAETGFSGAQTYLATGDGYLLAQTGSTDSVSGNLGNASLIQATESENYIVARAALLLKSAPALATYNKFWSDEMEIQGVRYTIQASWIQLSGNSLAIVVIIPRTNIWGQITTLSHRTLILLVALATCIFIIAVIIFCFLSRATSKEIQLCAALIQQQDARNKAEAMNSHKSMVLAQASHDLRTSVAAILGLINASHSNVSEGSELDLNLQKMKSCASDLLGILNSVLDTSKVESGKLQLEEAPINIVQVVEDVVDTFSVLALQKGIEVVLDMGENLGKELWVKGDAGRVKQILSNLLSNALKFTTEGHVLIRFWAQEVVPEKTSVPEICDAQKFMGLLNWTCKWSWKKIDNGQLGTHYGIHEDARYASLVFEVTDTGKGIPKNARETIFENFVQGDKFDAQRQDGTGLGLGIVRSLVHLMNGIIEIVDKDEPGERGTCFRFNLVLKLVHRKPGLVKSINEESTCSSQRQVNHPCGQISGAVSGRFKILSWKHDIRSEILENNFLHSESVYALIMMHGDVGKAILRNWLERRGVRVKILGHWEDLVPLLEMLRHEVMEKNYSSDSSRDYDIAFNQSFRIHSSRLSEIRIQSDIYKPKYSVIFLMEVSMIIDNLETISTILSSFLANSPVPSCKVICLANTNTPAKSLKKLREKLGLCDLILYKPVHGSRLHAIWEVVLEVTGKKPRKDSQNESSKSLQKVHSISDTPELEQGNQVIVTSRCLEIEESGLGLKETKKNLDRAKPLSGKNILVAEDNSVLRQIAKCALSKLGANVECVENGADAAQLVIESFQNGSVSACDTGYSCRSSSSGKSQVFDLIFMDCEMPIMDGYESTQKIREEEKKFGYHIPIIALTAHSSSEVETKCLNAGMDFQLTKPLNVDSLLNIISKLFGQGNQISVDQQKITSRQLQVLIQK